jgi:hypothetical protein
VAKPPTRQYEGRFDVPTVADHRTEVEQVLVDVTSLLLERARIELEREVETAGESATAEAANSLLRMRKLEDALRTIRRERSVAGQVSEPVSGRQVSKFYEVPGQEDA